MIPANIKSWRLSFASRLACAFCLGPFVLGAVCLAQDAGLSLASPPAPASTEAVPSASARGTTQSEPDVLPGFPQPPDQPGSLYAQPKQTFTCETLPGAYFDCDPRLDPPVLPQ